jgi:hypothetical protein
MLILPLFRWASSPCRPSVVSARAIVTTCTLLCSFVAVSASSWSGTGQNISSPTGVVRGYVYCGDTGQPARFAVIRIQSVASLGLEGGSGTAVVNAAQATAGLDGSFLIEGLSPGDYVVLATLNGYLFPLAQYSWNELVVDSQSPADPIRKRLTAVLPKVTIEPNQTSLLNLRLERGAEISGTTLYDDGSPVINAQIRVYRFAPEKKKWQEVQMPTDDWPLRRTDDRGVYRITGMPAGRYLVSARIPPEGGSLNAVLGGGVSPNFGASHPGRLEIYFGDTARQQSATPVEVTAGERRSAVDIHFNLSKLRTVSGTVSAESDGHALQQVALQLSFPDDRSTFLVAHVGQDGSFQIPFVLEGDYILTVSAAPEDGPHGQRGYKITDLPLSIHEDLSGLRIVLPDATGTKP